jgi:hypothetical protein
MINQTATGLLLLPDMWCYGNYCNDNYGVNSMAMQVGPVTMWFSYSTMVAFQVTGNRRVVQRNVWGPTTGRHLKEIDGGARASRVEEELFQRLWEEQAESLFYNDNTRSIPVESAWRPEPEPPLILRKTSTTTAGKPQLPRRTVLPRPTILTSRR